MPAFIHILALASVAILALSSGPTHVNALAAGRAQVARHAHDAIAKRKRDVSRRCIPRPSSSPTPTSTPPPASTPSPSSTSSSAPPSTTTPSNSAVNKQKKAGLAWGGDDQYLSNFASLRDVGYLYNWRADVPDLSKYGVARIPMLWGADQQRIEAFQAMVVPGYANIVFAFNEPNEPSQSNLNASYAFSLWMTYINPLKDHGYRLGSPACTDDDIGLAWYKDFFSLCNSDPTCQVDFITYHAYTTSADYLISYATQLHQTYNKPIWLTEHADQDYSGKNQQADMNQIWDYAGKVVNFVESTDWFEVQFPFGVVTDLQGVNPLNSLYDSANGYPTPLGYYYLDRQ